MPLPLPKLDDRTYAQLVDQAVEIVRQTCPEWTDLTPGDPGRVLLELYAFLTEAMIYRLNRLPDKAYVAFLRLLGVVLEPPTAATVTLRFSRSRAEGAGIDIPRNTRVTLNRADGGGPPPVFVTAAPATIKAGQAQVDVLAYHCEQIDAELVASGSGRPGLVVSVARPPVITRTNDGLDLVVAVEAVPDELSERIPAREYNGRTYRIWREVENFSNLGEDDFVYLVDRAAGTLMFAPAAQMKGAAATAALAAVPAKGREIRVWYRRGGGPEGNVAADTLTTLKDPIPGVEVTNPQPATGGRAAETLENALLRGPQELHSLERAVTAGDFELLARKSAAGVARAKAFTKAALWTYAEPGTVEVLLVPSLSDEQQQPGQVTAEALRSRQTPETRDQIARTLDAVRPLAITVLVDWAQLKTVRVQARIVVRREEDQAAVRGRVLERLYQTISPLPTAASSSGWRYGQALRASDIYYIALKEPGVRWVDQVQLLVDDVPVPADGGQAVVAADWFQPATWYAAGDAVLFRTLNAGEGWEAITRFPKEPITLLEAHSQRAGIVALVTNQPDGSSAGVYTSQDSGESWQFAADLQGIWPNDLAWVLRDGVPVLLLATNKGLYQLVLKPGAGLEQILVDPANQGRGFTAVTSITDTQGTVTVAVAAENTAGVWLSRNGGRPNTFTAIGLQGKDVRVLNVQRSGGRYYLWAGMAAFGQDDPGPGCVRWELRGQQDPDAPRTFGQDVGWTGGSCRALVFQGARVLAATHHTGVLRLDASAAAPKWLPPDINCGLPLRNRDQFLFQTVTSAASNPAGDRLMVTVAAGSLRGTFRSDDGGQHFIWCANNVFNDTVTLPDTWLFVSGQHDISVVGEDEAN